MLSARLLRSYQHRLAKLHAGNRALWLGRISKRTNLCMRDLDYLTTRSGYEVLCNLIAKKKRAVSICPRQDARLRSANTASEQLKHIWRKDKALFEETGQRELYVGYPFVEGRFPGGMRVRAPLVLFPVDVLREEKSWKLKLREEPPSFNRSLLLAFAHYTESKLPEALLEEDFEDFGKDIQSFLTKLYETLRDSPLSLRFSPEAFEESLLHFTPQTKQDIEQKYVAGQLHMQAQAVLGFFPQAGSALSEDYDFLLENYEKFKRLEDIFSAENKAQDKKSLGLAPFREDATQAEVHEKITTGQSCVVQGPPGTGKSQLIANLLADAMASGKRVLLVCQKRVALDVVYERLSSKNLTDFVARVHDVKHDRKKVYEKIKSTIENIDEIRKEDSSLDAITLERNWNLARHQADQASEELAAFWQALGSETPSGWSAQQLYLLDEPEKAAKIFERPKKEALTRTEWEKHSNPLLSLHRYGQKLQNKPWPESFTLHTKEALADLKNTLADFKETLENLQQEADALGLSVSFAAQNTILSIEELQTIFTDDLTYSRWWHWQVAEEGRGKMPLENAKAKFLEIIHGESPELSLASEDVAEALSDLEALQAANRKNRLSRWAWRKRNPDICERTRQLANANEKYDSIFSSENIDWLYQKVKKRWDLLSLLHELQAHPAFVGVPSSQEPEEVTNWFEKYEKLGESSAQILQKVFDFQLTAIPENREAFFDALRERLHVLERVEQKRLEWEGLFTKTQLESLLAEPKKAILWLEYVEDKEEILLEILETSAQLPEKAKVFWGKISPSLPEDLQDARAFVERSLYRSWLLYLENSAPILKATSSGKITVLQENLHQAKEEELKLSGHLALLFAREKTYKGLEFNRLGNRVTYRDLHHQVSKKRFVWPMRKLLGQFEEELFKLVPCWLASPESVASLFAMKPLFDLVIFDEASQCFAERGFPALFRARQAVVVGDSHQLRPSDLYAPRWEEAAEDDPELAPALEVESVLDFAMHFLPQFTLRGHYRSQLPELIEFSNAHFYNNKLQLVPEREAFNVSPSALQFTHVPEGVWEKQQNYAEALEVVRQFMRVPEELSVGIITFNAKQQLLIEDMLEEKQFTRKDYFVKNIENVQGDEADVILFSVGYGYTSSGQLRVQFGLLSQAGGENRLNVAITRARKAMHVICSFLPQALKVEETTHEGPKLFQAFLQFAYAQSQAAAGFRNLPPAAPRLSLRPTLAKRLQENTDWQFTGLPASLLLQNGQEGAEKVCFTDDEIPENPRARHYYSPAIFTRKGWKVEFLYSRKYWKKGSK